MNWYRRDLLGAAVVTATAGLAGCTGDGDETPTPTPDPGNGDGADAATVRVGPGGTTAFDPAELTVDVGAVVTFVWDSDGHNISVTSQPDDADWGGSSNLAEAGFEHAHTFEVPGVYEYQCDPHAGSGMRGAITVGDGDGAGDDGDDGDGGGY